MSSTPTNADRPAEQERERLEAIARIQKLIDDGFASGIGTRTMDDLLQEAGQHAGVSIVD